MFWFKVSIACIPYLLIYFFLNRLLKVILHLLVTADVSNKSAHMWHSATYVHLDDFTFKKWIYQVEKYGIWKQAWSLSWHFVILQLWWYGLNTMISMSFNRHFLHCYLLFDPYISKKQLMVSSSIALMCLFTEIKRILKFWNNYTIIL